MRFVLVTKYFTGLGFAIRLREEGHDVLVAVAGIDDQRLEARYDLVGRGLVDRLPLGAAIDARADWRDAYWIWDENHSVDACELLRAEGFRVLGGGRYANTMEHDRDACLQLVGRYGLQAPPSYRFERPGDALAHIEAHPASSSRTRGRTSRPGCRSRTARPRRTASCARTCGRSARARRSSSRSARTASRPTSRSGSSTASRASRGCASSRSTS